MKISFTGMARLIFNIALLQVESLKGSAYFKPLK